MTHGMYDILSLQPHVLVKMASKSKTKNQAKVKQKAQPLNKKQQKRLIPFRPTLRIKS